MTYTNPSYDDEYTCLSGLAVSGHAVAGVIPITAIRVPEQYAGLRLHVFDTSFVHQAVLANYQSLTWTRNWYTADTFNLVINRYNFGASQLVTGGFLAYYLEGTWRVGIIQSISTPLRDTGEASENLTVIGEGYETVFKDRQMIHSWAAGDGYTTEDHEAETNVIAYVHNEAITPTIAGRTITGLSHAPDQARGAVMTYKARAPQTLFDVIEDHSRFSGLSFKPVWTGYGPGVSPRETFVLTCFEGTDRSTTVKLAVEFGNIKTYNYVYSILNQKTTALVMGAGVGAARALETVHSSGTPTGRARKEIAIDASDLTTSDEYIARGQTELANKAQTVRLEFDYNYLAQNYTLGTDFFIGDIVSIKVADVTLTSRIISVTDIYNEQGRTQKLGVGQEFPDMKSIFKDVKAAISTGARA